MEHNDGGWPNLKQGIVILDRKYEYLNRSFQGRIIFTFTVSVEENFWSWKSFYEIRLTFQEII